MYECYRDKMVASTELFSVLRIISENLLFVSTWFIAGYLLWPVRTLSGLPVLTIIWAALVIVIQIALKKHNCSGCYYYDKMCHLGWGKISSALFKQDSGNPETGKKLSLFYILSPPLIFLTALLYTFYNSPSLSYWIGFGLYILLNIVSFPVRKNGCAKCTMKEVCPGSAVKSV